MACIKSPVFALILSFVDLWYLRDHHCIRPGSIRSWQAHICGKARRCRDTISLRLPSPAFIHPRAATHQNQHLSLLPACVSLQQAQPYPLDLHHCNPDLNRSLPRIRLDLPVQSNPRVLDATSPQARHMYQHYSSILRQRRQQPFYRCRTDRNRDPTSPKATDEPPAARCLIGHHLHG